MSQQAIQKCIIDRCSIVVVETIGKNCVTIADGTTLYQLIYAALGLGKPVALDFSGVDIFTHCFFSFSIGQLLKNFDSDFLNAMLSVERLNPVGQDTLEQAIESAGRFYFRRSNKDRP